MVTSVKHLANLGDQIAVLPACKAFYEKMGRKIKFLQMVNVPAAYYPNATHPTVDNNGTMVTLNQAMFDMMKPLMESQEYIDSYEVYNGQHVDLDFDVIRGKTFVGMPNLMLQGWIMMAYPDLHYNLSKPWMVIPDLSDEKILEQVKGKVILNFTERYRNPTVDYFFLKSYSPDLIFAGTEKEYWNFCNQWQLQIPRLEISNFLEYAYAIKNSRFFMGCQSFGWNLCQAMQHPRIVELCNFAPNVQPFIGEDSYGFFHTPGPEYYFKLLYNKYK